MDQAKINSENLKNELIKVNEFSFEETQELFSRYMEISNCVKKDKERYHIGLIQAQIMMDIENSQKLTEPIDNCNVKLKDAKNLMIASLTKLIEYNFK